MPEQGAKALSKQLSGEIPCFSGAVYGFKL